MKKYISSLVLLAFLSIILSCKKDSGNVNPSTGTELLQNGNLDGTTTNWFSGFESPAGSNPNNYVLELSEDFSVSPKKSIKIQCDKVNNTASFCHYNQAFSTTGLKAGAILTLNAKIKGVNLVGQGLSIAIRGDKTGASSSVFFRTTQGVSPITGTFDFKEFSVSLESYEGNADRIIVFIVFLPQTTGTAYIDDISLKSL